MSEKTQNSARAGRKTAQAIAALLTCRTIEEAAEHVGVSAVALRRWRSKPAFAAQMCRAQQEILAGVINELRGAGVSAASTLRNISADANAAPAARVRAAVAIINLLLKAHQVEVIELRLTALEAAAKQRRRDGRH
jgi:DNA-binding transcriptional MerR regulator